MGLPQVSHRGSVAFFFNSFRLCYHSTCIRLRIKLSENFWRAHELHLLRKSAAALLNDARELPICSLTNERTFAFSLILIRLKNWSKALTACSVMTRLHSAVRWGEG